jgi:hypothetical protein
MFLDYCLNNVQFVGGGNMKIILGKTSLYSFFYI